MPPLGRTRTTWRASTPAAAATSAGPTAAAVADSATAAVAPSTPPLPDPPDTTIPALAGADRTPWSVAYRPCASR